MVQAVARPCREAAAGAQPRGAIPEARAREVAAADLVRAVAVAAPPPEAVEAPPAGPTQEDSHAAAPRAMRETPAWRLAEFPSARLAGSPANLARVRKCDGRVPLQWLASVLLERQHRHAGPTRPAIKGASTTFACRASVRRATAIEPWTRVSTLPRAVMAPPLHHRAPSSSADNGSIITAPCPVLALPLTSQYSRVASTAMATTLFWPMASVIAAPPARGTA